MAHTPTPTPWTICNHSWSDTGIYGPDRRIALLSIESDATEEDQDKWEVLQAEDARLIVTAVNAFQPMREMLFRAIVELEYVRSVENCHSGLCASAEGAEIIEESMKLLGVKDLSEDALTKAVDDEHA